MKLTIHFDGGCHPNPGRMGIGVVIQDEDGKTLKEVSEALDGVGTNNVAEYSAIIRGMEEAKRLGASDIVIMGDSNLVIQQVLGRFRVKEPRLRPLYERVAKLAADFDSVDMKWIPREQNTRADALSYAPIAPEGASKGAPKPGSKPSPREHSILCPTCRKPCRIVRQTFKDGKVHLRQECPDHGFIGYAPDVEPFRSLAQG
jgi:ribonuclease HI